jgi:pimeloyl-ACP methyl ester carboxylesterase
VHIDKIGAGSPNVLYLHGELGPELDRPFVAGLAATMAVAAPHAPGFALSDADPALTSITDLMYVYLDYIDSLPSSADINLVGSSLGGWLAMEIAAVYGHRISSLILIGTVGVKLSGRTESDFVDVFNRDDIEALRACFADISNAPVITSSSADEEILSRARQRESLVRYGWQPYLHNPKLKQRLDRLPGPTFIIHGAEDQFVRPGYYADLSDAIAGAKTLSVPGAGHFPTIERPDATSRLVASVISATE